MGKTATIINDGPLMGYGIEGAFRSKAGFEIVREYLHVKFRNDVFGEIPVMDFAKLKRGIDRSAASLGAMLATRLRRLNIRVVQGRATFVDTPRGRRRQGVFWRAHHYSHRNPAASSGRG